MAFLSIRELRIRQAVLTLVLFVAATVFRIAPLHGAAQSAVSATLAVVGGRLIDGHGGIPLENSVILIEGDRIIAIGQVGRVEVPKQARVIRSDGMTVLPGLWESHGHLYHAAGGDPAGFQSKFKDRAPEIMARIAEISLAAGITSFRDTGVPMYALKQQLELRASIESGEMPGPRLYVAGPAIHQATSAVATQSGRFYVRTADEAKAAVEELVALKVDQIKVYGFWEHPLLEVVTATAHAAGLGVDADVRHMDAYRTAVKAGVDRLHHIFTADPLSDYSEDDVRLLVRGEKPTGLGPSGNIVRGPYSIPTMEMRQAYVRALRFPGLVHHPKLREQFPPEIFEHLHETWRSPESIPWGIGAVERMKVVKEKVRRFIQAGGREQLVAGTDAGSPLNFHSPLARELALLVEVGLSPMEAIQSATLRPAQMQGVDARLGTVAVGKLADLIVVDGDPLQDIRVLQHSIAHVIKGGVVYR